MSRNLDLSKLPQTLVVADYSSLEVGIQGDLAYRLYGDKQLLQMYKDQDSALGDKAVDIHSYNAKRVFGTFLGWKIPASTKVDKLDVLCEFAGENVDVIPVHKFKKHPFGKKLRDMIKAIWYGLAYGKGAYGFATLKGIDGKFIGEKRAQEMLDALLDSVPALRKWFAWVEDYVKEHWGIYSLGGRWCDLSMEMETGDEWRWKRAFRRAFNFPMQATGAEIIGTAMVAVLEDAVLEALGFRTCLQVHDELVLRGPERHAEEALGILKGHMRSATANGTQLLVDLQVSGGIGKNYYIACGGK